MQARVKSKETPGRSQTGLNPSGAVFTANPGICRSVLAIANRASCDKVLSGLRDPILTRPRGPVARAQIIVFGVYHRLIFTSSNRICAQPAAVSGVRQGFMSTGRSYNPYNVA